MKGMSAMVLRTMMLLVLAMMLAGCEESAPESTAAGKDKVTLVLNWFPEAEHGGFYAAKVHGFYEEAGLDVDIIPGGVDVPVVPRVATGRDQFGVVNADRIIYGQAQEADVVAVMAPIQISPRCVMVHEESAIESFEQMKNITLSMNPNDAFSAYLQKNFSLEGVTVVPYSGNVAQFLVNKDYAQQGYNISEPFTAQQQGARTRVLMLADVGYNPYTSCLVASRDYIESHPDIVQRMVAASIKGWQKYLDDPAATNAHINSLNTQMSMEILNYGAAELVPMVITGEVHTKGVGTMEAQRWSALLSTLEELNMVEAGKVKAEDLYTMRFLGKSGETR